MKQKMYGRKVQNWHRPLGFKQWRRRFRRYRQGAPLDEEELDYCNDWYELWDDNEPADVLADDLLCHELKQLSRAILHRPARLFRPEWVADNVPWRDDERSAAGAPTAKAEQFEKQLTAFVQAAARGVPSWLTSPEQFEKQLAAFVQGIKQFPNDPAARRRIADAVGEDVYLDVLKSAATPGKGEALVRNVTLFAPFWIRSPRTWDGGKTSLVDHLFTRYDVPPFLHDSWTDLPGLSTLKWLSWFILLAQGGSLRRAAALFQWNISSRFEHHLRLTSARHSPVAACAFAEIMRLGGSRGDGERILRNPAFVVDPTEFDSNDTFAAFWKATIHWIIAQGESVTNEQCQLILDWAMHKYTEGAHGDRRPFSWKGRGLQSVLRHSFDYQRQLERPWSSHFWKRHGWDWTPVDAALQGWSFAELTSGEALFREGQAMRHCVAGYATYCAAGRSAIVSVRFRDQRCLTVELAPADGRLLQARGACNRSASPDEQHVIHQWLTTVVWPRIRLQAT